MRAGLACGGASSARDPLQTISARATIAHSLVIERRGTNLFTLYYAPHTCALATHIALRDAAASYELKRIAFGKTEQQSAAYLAVNPKGRVRARQPSRTWVWPISRRSAHTECQRRRSNGRES